MSEIQEIQNKMNQIKSHANTITDVDFLQEVNKTYRNLEDKLNRLIDLMPVIYETL